ncbi:MAG: hypothetical protein ACMUIA_02060 [bacterium]
MKKRIALTLILVFLLGHVPLCLAGDREVASEDKNIKIDVNYDYDGTEDRDVGLKRMEILEKMLSPELLERKRSLVRSIEQDYDKKIYTILTRLMTPVAKNTVVTHIEVNFFDPEFESQIHATQKTSVSIILDSDAINNRVSSEKIAKENIINQIRDLIHTTFKIHEENISIVAAP